MDCKNHYFALSVLFIHLFLIFLSFNVYNLLWRKKIPENAERHFQIGSFLTTNSKFEALYSCMKPPYNCIIIHNSSYILTFYCELSPSLLLVLVNEKCSSAGCRAHRETSGGTKNENELTINYHNMDTLKLGFKC